MRKKVSFVILHYGDNYQLTMNAVRAIRQLDDAESADIVIVCNGKAFDIQQRVDISELNDVDVIVLEENKGFSVGNNVGYKYAKQKNDYAFIVIMNNDVVIEQKDFIAVLFDEYEKCPFFVCGPDVYTPSAASHFNPLAKEILKAENMDAIIHRREMQRREYTKPFSMYAAKSYFLETFKNRKLLSCIFSIWRKIKKGDNSYKNPATNVVLQGSCLIFSSDFIQLNEKAFEPEVFLYFEEHYLAKRCAENNWTMYYTPAVQVMHMHRGSSGLIGQSYRSYCQKKLKIEDYFIAAAKEAKEILK